MMLELGSTAMNIWNYVLSMTEFYSEFWIFILLIEDSANVISLFTIPTTDLDTSSSVADINMAYVTPIKCRLLQPTDGFVAYTI